MSEVPIHETPGDRVRMLRRRAGLSQRELGQRAGHGQQWVSQVERGDIELDKVSVVNELARALRCHPREILGTPNFATPAERANDAADDLVRQLRRLDLPPDLAAHRALPELEADLEELVVLRGEAKYAQLGARTVALIAELHAASAAPSQRDRERAFRILTHACKEAHSFGYGLGHPHLIELATSRARWCAERSDDPLLPALADYMAARDAWTTADWRDAMLLVDRAIDTVADAHAESKRAASLTGALHLRGAITSARSNDGDGAYARLEEAAIQAQLAKGADPYLNWFSIGNVNLHRVAVAVELGDGVEAVRRSKGLIIPKGLPNSRLAHHYLDTARGFVWVNEIERGLSALERAYRIAPQLVRHHPMAQATVRSLLRAERRSTRERLRTMADRLDVN
ncbi:helix-turn-helix transcriptional regulator [Actinospica sp. MGRD01-02]|uniref:Helix-turn-helix transcriptional regulator n=1 Tax=Actinospica acidithermotolerans TaxID=2828514 RepID=A0A941EHM8_9ACTN|nr:helix-turn-helix transcriptional regulator [Actinospica acidithermotolerans]MBR7827809.1 helix-turn-helix transcriptional regulator [Actinospica acidithermotolerans]